MLNHLGLFVVNLSVRYTVLHLSAAYGSSCHAACSVLGHKFQSLLLKLGSGFFLGVLTLKEFLIVTLHCGSINALTPQLGSVFIQVCIVVYYSMHLVTDDDDNAEGHENACHSEANSESDQIAILEYGIISVANI